jgi:hypothetical protein
MGILFKLHSECLRAVGPFSEVIQRAERPTAQQFLKERDLYFLGTMPLASQLVDVADIGLTPRRHSP